MVKWYSIVSALFALSLSVLSMLSMLFMTKKSPATLPALRPQNEPDQAQEAVLVLDRESEQRPPPPLHRVVLLNDDYTPMDFVVDILRTYFNKNQAEAMQIMLSVHTQGKATCGIYPKDVAITKVSQVMAAARDAEHPLQCMNEPHI
jgi:ATP-dependent Clp protease adaptor protein ClpS